MNINRQKKLEENSFAEGLKFNSFTGPTNSGIASAKANVDGKLNSINKVLNGYDKFSKDSSLDNRSLVARSKNSVCQFPVYITHSIRSNEAHTISKAFERVYATLLQTVLSQNPVVDESELNNMAFLTNFHNNLKESGEYWIEKVTPDNSLNLPSIRNDFYESIDEFDEIMQDTLYRKIQINENMQAVFRVVPCTDRDIIKIFESTSHEPLAGLSYLQESSDVTHNIHDVIDKGDIANAIEDYNNRNGTNIGMADMARDIISGKRTFYLRGEPELDADGKQVKNSAGKPLYTPDKDRPIRVSKAGNNTVFHNGDKSVTVKDQLKDISAPQLLRDSDLKKINGMLPYTMEVNFRVRKAAGNTDTVSYVIGVKTILHMINPHDLSDEIREILSGKEKNLQKVRYKTGEIKMADYLFNIKGLKADASKHINTDKRWLNTLKRLGDYESLNGTFLKTPAEGMLNGKVPVPVGTLILTQSDVLKINDETGVDISQVSVAKRLAKALFLISVVIVDSTGGNMMVLMTDSDTEWDVQSLSSLEIETSKTDNSGLVKELNRMINR